MTTVLFCPFCREPFEGTTECPDHGVALVPLGTLAELDSRKLPAESAKLALHDLRFGRGIVLVGALLTWLALFLPAVVDHFHDDASTTGFALWQLRADYLTVVPGAALLAVFAAMSRGTRAQLRRVRLAIGIALGLAVAALGLAAFHILRYADESIAAGDVGGLEAGSGAYVALLGLGILALGTYRLGGPAR
jgi:hypothetical protein